MNVLVRKYWSPLENPVVLEAELVDEQTLFFPLLLATNYSRRGYKDVTVPIREATLGEQRGCCAMELYQDADAQHPFRVVVQSGQIIGAKHHV